MNNKNLDLVFSLSRNDRAACYFIFMFIKKIRDYLHYRKEAKDHVSYRVDTRRGLIKSEIADLTREAKIRRRLYVRKYMLNDAFVWSSENTQKIIELNDGLLKVYRKAYDEMKVLKDDFDAKIAAGNSAYDGYVINMELEFHYPHGLTPKEQIIWFHLVEATDHWGSSLYFHPGDDSDQSFEKQMSIDDLSWCEYPFNVKELDNTYIHFFMHDIFDHNETFSLADAVKMKAEDFSYEIKVTFEHKRKFEREY